MENALDAQVPDPLRLFLLCLHLPCEVPNAKTEMAMLVRFFFTGPTLIRKLNVVLLMTLRDLPVMELADEQVTTSM